MLEDIYRTAGIMMSRGSDTASRKWWRCWSDHLRGLGDRGEACFGADGADSAAEFRWAIYCRMRRIARRRSAAHEVTSEINEEIWSRRAEENPQLQAEMEPSDAAVRWRR